MERKYRIKVVEGPDIIGDGSLTGEVSCFVVFSGCNMWDGRQVTKGASRCPFCDVDFEDGEYKTGAQILEELKGLMAHGWVTLTGGEPLLQLDYDLADTLVHAGYRLHVETNGTRHLTHDMRHLLSHVTLSPSVTRGELKLKSANDLRVLVPHPDKRITPEAFADFKADRRFLTPIGHPDRFNRVNVQRTLVELYRLNNERHLDEDGWVLSAQTRKTIPR